MTEKKTVTNKAAPKKKRTYRRKKKTSYISEGAAWSSQLLEEYYSEIERIASEKFGLDTYPNQLEIITSEQMLDAYSSVAMPVMYNHWSFGKSFVTQMEQYKRGQMGLAYEVVINSKPCIAYLMEDNTMLMQILVMAHACFGHNTFFKTNYLFQQWTDAESIIDYLVFAKKYIADCEERYGPEAVEEVLDSCHAIQMYGVDRYKRPAPLSLSEERARQEERANYIQRNLNDLWRTIPNSNIDKVDEDPRFPPSPEENILYFIEKNAPYMETWKREIIRIVRKISQYFYPQMQTKLMNEGCATFWHYQIVTELHKEGKIPDGYMLEFFDSHSAVTAQPGFDHPYFSGINVYALGYAMYTDIKRVAMDPTDEDREWFGGQDWVGCGDWIETIKWASANFKDESFVQQFLSPKVIRDFKLFAIIDDDEDTELEVEAIHNKQGYLKVREVLSHNYNINENLPYIQVYNVDRQGDRSLTLRHYTNNRRQLEIDSANETLKHIRRLWGFDVVLEAVNGNDEIQTIYKVTEETCLLEIFD